MAALRPDQRAPRPKRLQEEPAVPLDPAQLPGRERPLAQSQAQAPAQVPVLQRAIPKSQRPGAAELAAGPGARRVRSRGHSRRPPA
mmetsp:Transcript_14620/g.32006  ORF Transcript_14620/g.32006 Transcript_14620/m.32006 type:complete len:86 (+) Transcript_14620:46-303(+)